MIIVALAVLGIIFGSFVNALVWRLRQQELLASSRHDQKSKTKGQRPKARDQKPVVAEDLSILKGRSMCPRCHHTLGARDLVPVLSWLSLGGKCRYCHKPISWQYPLVELFTGLFFVVSYLSWPLALHDDGVLQFVLWLAFLVGFMALGVYDLRWFLLPDRIVGPLVALAAAETAANALWLHSFNALWQPVAGAAIIFGLFWLLYQVSGGKWIGGGDVKLAIVLGLLAGTPLKAFLVIFFASFLGTLVSIPDLARGKQGLKLRIPFGPYLLLATVVVVLYGTHVANWYQNLFLR